jgi:acyl transferase domain-containing protein
MGDLMQRHLIGGQIIYPIVDENWAVSDERKTNLLEHVLQINAKSGHHLNVSIDLGGMLVFAGNEAGLKAFEESVPKVKGRFPMRLRNHAAFHSTFQQPVSDLGKTLLKDTRVRPPNLPLIDGSGKTWWPDLKQTAMIWDYTLGSQVTEPYDFSTAIATAAKEFAPDLFIVAGPGNTLGSAVVQSLIACGWNNWENKVDFENEQMKFNLLVSMGRRDQRDLVI